MLATLPHVNLDRACRAVHRAEAPIWRHNVGAVRTTLACSRKAHRQSFRATLRGWDANGTRVLTLRMVVRPVRRHATHTWEDGSGWITYSRRVSLYVDPGCQTASPCVDG